MFTDTWLKRLSSQPTSALKLTLALLVGLISGLMIWISPLLLAAGFISMAVLVCFFWQFEYTVLGFVVLRSSLDILSDQQVPALFGVGLVGLSVLRICWLSINRQKIQTDWMWWIFAAWVMLQGVWVILLPLGGLGLGAEALPNATREWVRLFSILMGYFLVMQLKDRVSPQRVISALFLSLIAPLTAASMQLFLPSSLLPGFLSARVRDSIDGVDEISRINGTLGHANSFACFSVLLLGLIIWKIENSKNRLPWTILAVLVAFMIVNSKSLTGLVMLGVFGLTYFLPKLRISSLLAGGVLFAAVGGLVLASDIGQERFAELYSTPLLNPDLDWNKAVFLQMTNLSAYGNSFNWRLAQWTFLLRSWQDYPILGYGLETTKQVSALQNTAHNDYIRFLVEGGVVGFSLFISFLLLQLVRLVQVYKSTFVRPKRRLILVLISILLSMLVAMLAGNIIRVTVLFFYWSALLAILDWPWSVAEDSTPDRAVARLETPSEPGLKGSHGTITQT